MALLQSRQRGMDRGQRLQTIAGSPPDLSALPPGCSFARVARKRVRNAWRQCRRASRWAAVIA
ncbi:hypothetical protein ACU4HD_11250 [Cupriavidus basilensis]